MTEEEKNRQPTQRELILQELERIKAGTVQGSELYVKLLIKQLDKLERPPKKG